MKLLENHKSELKQIELKITKPNIIHMRYKSLKKINMIMDITKTEINSYHLDSLKNNQKSYVIKNRLKQAIQSINNEIDNMI